MIDDDRLDPAMLGAYEVPEPAHDLPQRFAERLAQQTVRQRARWPYVVAGLAAAAIAVFALRTTPHTYSGSSSTTARTSEKLGDRGVAVVEAGGSIAWEVTAHAAHVRQERGDVFYRVERATDVFEVATPQATVRVRGTCFRVALDAYGASVTVYEGTVELANPRGQITLTAGEKALATRDVAPHLMSAIALAPPVATASTADLLARDRSQRDRITELEATLAALTTPPVRPFEMNHEQLAELAQRCMAPHEVLPIAGSTVMDSILEKGARSVGLTAEEHAALDRVIERTQPTYEEGLRRFYAELTGESGAALDPLALITEITAKSSSADTAVAMQRIANERVAGAVRATADARSSVIERYARFAIASADAFETQLASEIGRDRAHVFRRTWGMVNLAPGCP